MNVIGIWLAVLVSSLGVAACSSGTGSSPGSATAAVSSDSQIRSTTPASRADEGKSDPGEAPPASNVEQAGAAQRELARYDVVAAVGYTAQERSVIDAAWSSVFASCMGQAGFNVLTPPVTTDVDSAFWELSVLRFDDETLIGQHGYHWTDPGWLDDGDDDLAPASEPPSGYDTNAEHCKQVANDRLSGGSATGEVENLLLEGQQSVRARLRAWPERGEYMAQWTRCMDERGFPGEEFADPSRVRPYLDQPVTQGEIDMALADSACRGDSGYRDALLEELATGVDEWLDENETLTVSIRQMIDDEVAAAEAVLEH